MGVLASWTLTQQCGPSRPFCRSCVNSFSIYSCGPTLCKGQPQSTICLHPVSNKGECSICKEGIKTAGINKLKVPVGWPASWNGSFSADPVGPCQWYGLLPEIEEPLSEYYDAVSCPVPIGVGLVGNWVTFGSISILVDSLSTRSFRISIRKQRLFRVSVQSPFCPSIVPGTLVGQLANPPVTENVGGFILNLSCVGTFIVTNFDSSVSSVDSVSM